MSFRLLALLTAAACAGPALAVTPLPPARADSYLEVVNRVAALVNDSEAQRLAAARELRLLNVLWEDTGRYQGSAVGPNISDVTIEVVSEDAGQRKLALMPVLRFPNFSDRTADVPIDRVWLRVGNAKEGGGEDVISLKEFLAEPGRWLSGRDGGAIRGSLLAERDTHALVSAQATLLPVPRAGKATFHPVIFNYQSTAGNPAVLTLLVTRQGTSMTVIDNARDTVSGRGSWGQRLFFNAGGQRAPLTAERLSDVQARGTTSNGESAADLGADANLLMLVQVPLKYRQPERPPPGLPMPSAAPMVQYKAESARAKSDMETAVLGHGALQGPFTELAGLTVERDPRFPVRVTVQFYQATSSGQLTAEDVARLAQQLGKVYEKGDYVGSLVVPTPADRRRPTHWEGNTTQPPNLTWEDFPGLGERRKKQPPIGIE